LRVCLWLQYILLNQILAVFCIMEIENVRAWVQRAGNDCKKEKRPPFESDETWNLKKNSKILRRNCSRLES